jgi:hypothetical protein
MEYPQFIDSKKLKLIFSNIQPSVVKEINHIITQNPNPKVAVEFLIDYFHENNLFFSLNNLEKVKLAEMLIREKIKNQSNKEFHQSALTTTAVFLGYYTLYPLNTNEGNITETGRNIGVVPRPDFIQNSPFLTIGSYDIVPFNALMLFVFMRLIKAMR